MSRYEHQVAVVVPHWMDMDTETPEEVEEAARKHGMPCGDDDYYEEDTADGKHVFCTEDETAAQAFANEVRGLGYKVELTRLDLEC